MQILRLLNRLESLYKDKYLCLYLLPLKTKERLNRILAENTGKSIEEIYRDTDRDNFMSAQEALDYGLIDSIITRSDSIK